MIKKAFILKYGQSTLPHSQVLAGGDPTVKCPISFCIYLLQANGRNVLVDAGCDTMPGFEMEHFCSPVEILSRLGLAPSDVTDVIITHAHHDHIEALHHFANATVYIQKEALVKGQKYIPSTASITAFEERCTVTEGIEIIHIGGHAKGSSVVRFSHNGTDRYIVGDECYTPDCVRLGIPTGVSCDPARSAAFLKEYAAKPLLYCHDPAVLPDQNGVLQLL